MPDAPPRSSEPPAAADTPDSPETPTAGEPSRRPAFIAFLGAEAVALVFYMLISRSMWFYLDEWDFLANRTAGNVGDLFRAHNEHWVTLPVLVYRGLWWIFGLRSYRPYQLVIVLLHLGAALLVRAVMRRVGVRPWTATIVACVLVFLGSGYQNIVLPFQMTLVGSLVFGLVHLLLATHDGPMDRRDLYGLAAGLAGLMCSGVGVSMVIAVGTAVLITRGWRLALLHTVPLGAAFLAWYAAIGHRGFTGHRAKPGQIVSFVRTFVAAGFSAMGHNRDVGVLIGILLIGGLVVAWRPLDRAELRRRAALPLGLLVGAVALLVITGVGRAGPAAFPEKSRYLHLIAALTLPAIGVAADAVMRRWRWLSALVIAMLVVPIPGNLNVVVDYMHRPIVRNQVAYKQMMLSLPRAPVANEVPRQVKPDQYLAHFVTIGWLLDGARSGRIPKPSSISPAETAIDDLRLSFLQEKAPLAQGDVCVSVLTPRVFDLARGQRIVIGAPNGSLRISSPTVAPQGTYPFVVVTVLPAGSNLIAVRPVRFRLSDVTGLGGQVCATPPIIQAAVAAGASTH